LVLVASPVDFSKDNGTVARWSKSLELEKIVNELGHMNGTLLDVAFMLRNPLRNLFDKYFKLFQKVDDRKFVKLFFAVKRWLNNTPDIPRPYYNKFIKSQYKENSLLKDNLALFENDSVNLKKIKFPVMTVTSVNDDLVSLESTEALSDYIESHFKKIKKYRFCQLGMFHSEGYLYSNSVLGDPASARIDLGSNIIHFQTSNPVDGLLRLVQGCLRCFGPSFIRPSNDFYYFCYLSHQFMKNCITIKVAAFLNQDLFDLFGFYEFFNIIHHMFMLIHRGIHIVDPDIGIDSNHYVYLFNYE
jgi:hypothetical protein